MIKGANVDLAGLTDASGPVVVSLGYTDPSGTGEADVSVLLLNASGKVRSDADLVFYNQPATVDESVRLLGKTPTGSGTEDRILMDLGTLASDVHRVVVAASRHGGATFGALNDLRLALSDSAGEALLAFDITDASVETAFIFGELYRRDDGWRFRAVGQGYESGLAGLATDFGIIVDESDDVPAEDEALADGALGQNDPPTGPKEASGESDGEVKAKVGAKAEGGTGGTGDEEPAGRSEGRRRPERVRTAKKKITLPRTASVDLADDPSWQAARLFSVTGLRNDQEREARATSTLLAVMVEVPEFGRRVTGRFNAPAGTVQTFAETTFKHGDAKVRPDGVIRVARAGRIWTALVETKTGGNPLKKEQVESYLEVAAKHGYETVITLSNELGIDGEHPLSVDRRRLRKVGLRHLSWAEVAHEAHMLCHHHGVANPAHAWLLKELLDYLGQANAGCHGFQDMGPGWVPVRNAITAGTLRLGDKRAMQVAESWEKLVRQLCLHLSGQTGSTVAPVLRRKRDGDSAVRRLQTVSTLVESGRMSAEIRLPSAPGPVLIEADLRTGQIETSVEVPSAVRARALTRVQWLLRQLAEAPPELRVEALSPGSDTGPCDLLKNLKAEPGLLVPDGKAEIISFRLTLPTGMGTKRGTEETGFVRSVDAAMSRFHEVLQMLKPEAASAPERSSGS
ncbi:TerD family protein [Actinomadura xylanilytica]|uniref:TerD family protein n=1 Tax=Actinomadura xylanilytica TaxID=887459 RepID=UPI00255AAA5A|nr:TerD family protein [Actinomadura xylanilytica]MDL4773170.1 TerD family protein [Actinomadura xylanilytica]